MCQEIEIEFKNLLTRSEFKRLCEYFSISEEQFIEQENHYFDTPDFSLKEHKSALRIRKKNEEYVLTLKQPHEIGKLETHQKLTYSEANEMLEQGPFIQGQVKDIIEKLNVNVHDIQYLGTLKTNRVEIEYNEGMLVFDHSEYLGVEDFELEYEVTDEETGKQHFLNLLDKLKITQKDTNNKIMRFFLEKERQLKS